MPTVRRFKHSHKTLSTCHTDACRNAQHSSALPLTTAHLSHPAFHSHGRTAHPRPQRRGAAAGRYRWGGAAGKAGSCSSGGEAARLQAPRRPARRGCTARGEGGFGGGGGGVGRQFPAARPRGSPLPGAAERKPARRGGGDAPRLAPPPSSLTVRSCPAAAGRPCPMRSAPPPAAR